MKVCFEDKCFTKIVYGKIDWILCVYNILLQLLIKAINQQTRWRSNSTKLKLLLKIFQGKQKWNKVIQSIKRTTRNFVSCIFYSFSFSVLMVLFWIFKWIYEFCHLCRKYFQIIYCVCVCRWNEWKGIANTDEHLCDDQKFENRISWMCVYKSWS